MYDNNTITDDDLTTLNATSSADGKVSSFCFLKLIILLGTYNESTNRRQWLISIATSRDDGKGGFFFVRDSEGWKHSHFISLSNICIWTGGPSQWWGTPRVGMSGRMLWRAHRWALSMEEQRDLANLPITYRSYVRTPFLFLQGVGWWPVCGRL